jgi:hypothetical protein
MRTFTRAVLLTAVLALPACTTTPSVTKDQGAAEREITQRVSLMLDRYSRNDQAGVVAMLDPDRFVILGSNFDEKVTTVGELRGLMDRDFSQWGKASFADIRELDVRTDGTLATANFIFTFSAANGPTLPIRGTTTWRKVKHEWLLTQSTSALPPMR